MRTTVPPFWNVIGRTRRITARFFTEYANTFTEYPNTFSPAVVYPPVDIK